MRKKILFIHSFSFSCFFFIHFVGDTETIPEAQSRNTNQRNRYFLTEVSCFEEMFHDIRAGSSGKPEGTCVVSHFPQFLTFL